MEKGVIATLVRWRNLFWSLVNRPALKSKHESMIISRSKVSLSSIYIR